MQKLLNFLMILNSQEKSNLTLILEQELHI